MGSLIGYELKKMLSRRESQVSIAAVMVFVAVIAIFNITSQHALDPKEMDTEFEGTAAIAQNKANAEALAGPVTDEEATETLREFKEFVGPDGEVKEEYRTDRKPYGEKADEYWEFRAKNSALVALLTSPWMQGYQMPESVAATIDTTGTVDLYGQVRSKMASELDANGALSYNDEEREFWSEKAQGVHTPIEYGYAGGWEELLDLAQFLIFAMLAVVITCASVFNGEYRAKTDAILLSTKFGKSRLGRAKAAASVIAASAIYWVFTLVFLAIPLVFYGADGAGLPIQIYNITCTYGISLSAAALICCLVGYLATLALLGIVLALSAKIDSPMGILAVGVALILVPVFVPTMTNSIANHIIYLFPYDALNPFSLFDMVSYAIGPVVVELPVFLAAFYLLLFAAGITLAIRTFKRHQVA